ncbi:MAG: hypothetical protein ABIZ57_09315 [Candidatus Limnocylindria bacterium]
MIRSRPPLRLARAIAIAMATTLVSAGMVLAHPESEGDHPAGCVVTVEPGSVAVGAQFTVAGNFGGASIYLVEGADAAPAEDAEPIATTPEGSSFSVTFTAEVGDVGDVGEWTVIASIPASECGDSDGLIVTSATIPDVAMAQPSSWSVVMLGWLTLLIGLVMGSRRMVITRC